MSSPIIDASQQVEHHETTLTTIKDSIHSIKQHILRFFSGTVLSRISGLIRDVIIAYSFGAEAAIAALFVAFRLSQLLRRLFGEGPVQSALIPLFEELRKDSSERAFRFFRDLCGLFLIILVGLTCVIMCGAGLSLHFQQWSPSNQEILFLVILLIPSLIPICLFGINMALLQCQKQYFTPGVAPAFFNISIAIGALLFQKMAPKEAMPYLAFFIVLGCVLQWFVTFPATYRHMKEALKDKMFSSINIFSDDVKRVGKFLTLGMLGVGAAQINNTVDTLFARYADLQGPAYLWYGLRLLQLPLALFGIAVAGAVLPPISRAIQNKNREDCTHYLDYATRRVIAFLVPCIIATFVFGTHMINAIYGHGNFSIASTFTTTACLHAYIIGLLPMGFIMVFAPVCYAYNDWKTPTIGAILSLCTNCALNIFFIHALGLKAVSVALATSISSWLNLLFISYRLQKRAGTIITKTGLQECVKVICISVAAGIITWIIQANFFTPASFFMLNTVSLPRDVHSQILAVVYPGAIYGMILFTLGWLWGFAPFRAAPAITVGK